MTHYHRIILEFDGASKNNPRGPAGCGYVLHEMDSDGAKADFIDSGNQYLGHYVSNNQAEYQGLINGLKHVRNQLTCYGLYIRGDSEIVVKQMNGEYAVRSSNIRPYFNEAREILDTMNDCDDFTFYKVQHIPRDKNWWADDLANSAIDD